MRFISKVWQGVVVVGLMAMAVSTRASAVPRGAAAAALSRAAMMHAMLLSSHPAPGDTLTAHLDRIRLGFSEEVDEAFALITLTDGTGKVRRLSPRTDPSDVYALIADCPDLAPGGYLVSWRVVSADGHPVGGYFQFYSVPAGKTAAEVLSGAPKAPEAPTEEAQGPAGATGEPPVWAAILRGTSEMALMALLGLLAMLTWAVPARHSRLAKLEIILVSTTPLLLAADFLLWLQHASPTGTIDGDAIAAAFSTRNGVLYGSRVGLALGAAWGLWLVRRAELATFFAAAAVVVTGATGHPAAISPTIAIPAKIVHLAAISLWTGGLLVLALGDRNAEDFRRDAWRVSRIALIAVLAVAVTGSIETLLFLPRLAGLFSSAYGWLVLGKLAGLSVLVTFGWRNRYRLIPSLTEAGPAGLRRSVRWETGWMVAVVILAAFLSYLPPPMPAGMQMTMQGHSMPGHVMPPARPEDQ